MSHDARHPDAPVPRVQAGEAIHLSTMPLPPRLVGRIGEAFAGALSVLQTQVGAFGAGAAADAVLAELGRLERLGLQLQAFARVLERQGQGVRERVDLAAAARAALTEASARARAAGIVLVAPHDALDVEVNAGVLEQLLELALDQALQIGRRIVVEAALAGLPPRPTLTLTTERADGAADDADALAWQLFALLARATGHAPQRSAVGNTVVLTLGLPVAETTPAPAGPRSAAELPRTPLAPGRRVLLVDPHELLRLQAHRLMHEAGMDVTATASVEQARAALRDGLPDVLVLGLRADEAEAAQLIAELRAAQPRLRVVELVDDDSAFALSVSADRPARVGRHDLARTLLPAIAQELDAAWDA